MNRLPMRRAHRLLVALVGGALLTSCAAPPLDVRAMVKEWGAYMQRDYVLRPNDEIAISLHPKDQRYPEPQTLVIPASGIVYVARLDKPVVAVGRPIRVLRAEIQEAYRQVFSDEVIAQVSLTATAAQSIYIAGEVPRPGPVPYIAGMRLTQAIAAAGGFDYRAKLTDVRVIRLGEGQEAKTIRVNVDEIFHSSHGQTAPDFLLLPGDVVYCQSVWIAELSDILNLYLWDLLPFNQASTAATGF